MVISVLASAMLATMVGQGHIKPASNVVLVHPSLVLKGSNSSITKREIVLATNGKQWAAIWARHAAQKPDKAKVAPDVNFAKSEVVCIFQGSGWNSNGVIPTEIADVGDSIRVRFDDDSYQTAGPDGGGERCTPFGMFVIPKSSKSVTVWENTQGLMRGAPIWKLRATLIP